MSNVITRSTIKTMLFTSLRFDTQALSQITFQDKGNGL